MIPIGNINFDKFGIPGGPGAEQMPTGIAAGIAGMTPAMQQKNLGSGPKTLEGPINIQPEFDQYGQPRMHTPGMQQVQVPNPNYGIDPATNKTPNQYLPGIGYINVTGNAETTLPGQLKLPGQLEKVVRPGGMQPYVPPLPDFYKGFGEDDKTGIMYNDTFYRAADPRRTTMDMSPLDGLIASDPEFANRFRAGEFDFVKDPGDGVMPELDNIGLITNAPGYNPVTPQQPTGGMNSDFANQLLSGIGNLFDKYLSSPSMKQNNLGMGSTNQITPPTPPEQMMTADTSSSLPASLGSQGMFTPGRGY